MDASQYATIALVLRVGMIAALAFGLWALGSRQSGGLLLLAGGIMGGLCLLTFIGPWLMVAPLVLMALGVARIGRARRPGTALLLTVAAALYVAQLYPLLKFLGI